VPFSRHRAFGIARQAGSADLGPRRVNHARRRYTDFSGQCRAAFAVATHARQSFIDEFFRDQIERRVVLGGEAGPVRGIRTACAAGLARAFGSYRGMAFHAAGLEHDRDNGNRGRADQMSLGGSQTRLRRHLALSRSRRSGYFSSRCSASITRSVLKLRKSLRSSHHAASSRTASW
jgi:hypothetical protein